MALRVPISYTQLQPSGGLDRKGRVKVLSQKLFRERRDLNDPRPGPVFPQFIPLMQVPTSPIGELGPVNGFSRRIEDAETT